LVEQLFVPASCALAKAKVTFFLPFEVKGEKKKVSSPREPQLAELIKLPKTKTLINTLSGELVYV
jgi:hypothetical protein